MICKECGNGFVYIKKHGLCKNCYQRMRKRMRPRKPEKEVLFAKTFFKDGLYIHHPALFRFIDGTKYTPDFYDMERGVFIEFVGSRQAYHLNKEKIQKFRSEYPNINLEVRLLDGGKLDESNDRLDFRGCDMSMEEIVETMQKKLAI